MATVIFFFSPLFLCFTLFKKKRRKLLKCNSHSPVRTLKKTAFVFTDSFERCPRLLFQGNSLSFVKRERDLTMKKTDRSKMVPSITAFIFFSLLGMSFIQRSAPRVLYFSVPPITCAPLPHSTHTLPSLILIEKKSVKSFSSFSNGKRHQRTQNISWKLNFGPVYLSRKTTNYGYWLDVLLTNRWVFLKRNIIIYLFVVNLQFLKHLQFALFYKYDVKIFQSVIHLFLQ